jgi:group I intron endonuclease
VSIGKRWGRHKRELRKGIHFNVHLQGAWEKYGEGSFLFSILEICEKSSLREREQYYLDTVHPEYNMLPYAVNSGDYFWPRLWHKTDQGREWARNNCNKYKDVINKKHTSICEQCGKEYQAKFGRFCSHNCAAKWRHHSGLDDVVRECVVCGKAFTTNKHKNTLTCSTECSRTKAVIQMDTVGNFVQKFKSLAEAEKQLGINRSSICMCCKGKHNTAGGFIWRYADKAGN